MFGMASFDHNGSLNAPLQDNSAQADCSLINVATIDGSVIRCSMAADSIVQDLLDAASIEDKDVVVDKAHTALVSPVLVTEDGVAMERSTKLSEYGLSPDTTVMMVKKRAIEGWYKCWVVLDTNISLVHGLEEFDLHIGGRAVCINGVEGRFVGDIHEGEQISVTFPEPFVIRTNLPNSNAFFRVTGCNFLCACGDYSSPWWHPIEGKLIGTSFSGGLVKSSGAFKGRFHEASRA